jgi:hypothetical protein
LLLFGVINVLIPGLIAVWTRTVAVAIATGALLGVPGFAAAVIVFLTFVWIPAFLLEWTVGRVTQLGADEAPFPPRPRARLATVAIIVAVAAGSMLFRWTSSQGLHQSAALFVGLPAVLAIAVVLIVAPRSATGVACKAVTVGLLVSLLFLGEGVLCVLMSAPLFYLVAIVIGRSMDTIRNEDRRKYSLRAAVPVLVVIVMSLEGVHHTTSFDREETVTVIRTVAAPADAVARAVFERPRFERAVPGLLRAGFPQPIYARRDPPAVGARWTIAFRGGEMRLDGIEPRIGDLTLELVESAPGIARWEAIGDESHMTHYLAWRGSTVRWTPVSARETRVEWTVRYKRSLDPAWYFGPIERFAVTLAAGYLIDSVATP